MYFRAKDDVKAWVFAKPGAIPSTARVFVTLKDPYGVEESMT